MPDGRGDIAIAMPQHSLSRVRLDLRILATTDIHMNLQPYDYHRDHATGRPGLARVSTLIAQRRQEISNSLLFDNGDTFQGTPMGDLAAQEFDTAEHPAISAMNRIGYDAAALGNHDFNYGLRVLHHITKAANFPFLAANLHVSQGRKLDPYVILDRSMIDRQGLVHSLRIGVIGLLPPQTAAWDTSLHGKVSCDDIVTTARELVPQIRSAGADIIIALAHSGIGTLAETHNGEHACAKLASVVGIDAVIAGHAHQVFPGPDFAEQRGIDPLRGALSGKPAVMPGFAGSHLGVIDLCLALDENGRWHVSGFKSRAEEVDPTIQPDPGITAVASRTHRATLRHLAGRVGHCSSAIFSHASLIGLDPGARLINLAQTWHIRQQLGATDIPVLSAASPYRAGGRGGPTFYTDIAPGALRIRHLSDLYCFPNRICALRITGAQLEDWLERTAAIFLHVLRGQRDATLLDPEFPAYNFDLISGVTWEIDLSRKPRYLPDGRTTGSQSPRVTKLRHRGQDVSPDQAFILATNSFRLSRCGLFDDLVRNCEPIYEGTIQTTDILRSYVRRRRTISLDQGTDWRFASQPDSSVLFHTGPGALNHLDAIRAHHRRPVDYVDHTDDGFVRLRLKL